MVRPGAGVVVLEHPEVAALEIGLGVARVEADRLVEVGQGAVAIPQLDPDQGAAHVMEVVPGLGRDPVVAIFEGPAEGDHLVGPRPDRRDVDRAAEPEQRRVDPLDPRDPEGGDRAAPQHEDEITDADRPGRARDLPDAAGRGRGRGRHRLEGQQPDLAPDRRRGQEHQRDRAHGGSPAPRRPSSGQPDPVESAAPGRRRRGFSARPRPERLPSLKSSSLARQRPTQGSSPLHRSRARCSL